MYICIYMIISFASISIRVLIPNSELYILSLLLSDLGISTWLL